MSNKQKEIKLNIGCRNKPLPTYVNVDIDPSNELADVIDNGFGLNNFKDDSVIEIASQHMNEHCSYVETKKVFQVWFNKLKKNGIVRISVPDMEKCSALLLLTKSKNLVRSMFYGSQKNEWDFHKNLFTKESLTKELQEAGFSNVKEWEPHNTFPFSYVDTYADCYYPDFHKKFKKDNGEIVDFGGVCLSLNLEAVKP